MNPMQTLEQAIEAAGGVSALARSLGVAQATVSNWKLRGSIPKGWLKVIQIQYKKHLKPIKEVA
jgi:hypothetical protein